MLLGTAAAGEVHFRIKIGNVKHVWICGGIQKESLKHTLVDTNLPCNPPYQLSPYQLTHSTHPLNPHFQLSYQITLSKLGVHGPQCAVTSHAIRLCQQHLGSFRSFLRKGRYNTQTSSPHDLSIVSMLPILHLHLHTFFA